VEFTLLGSVLVAVLALYGTLWFEARRGSAADCVRDVWDMVLAGGIAGLVAGRLGAMVLAGTNPITSPGDILIVRSGVDTVVASVVALATFGWVARRDLWRLADAAAAPALAGLAGWHASCILRDACAGTPTDLPWAVTSPGGTVGRHPVEMYAALALAVGAAALALWRRRARPAGVAAGLALAGAGLVRLLTEPLRPSLGGGPWEWYLAAVVAGAAIGIWRMRRVSR